MLLSLLWISLVSPWPSQHALAWVQFTGQGLVLGIGPSAPVGQGLVSGTGPSTPAASAVLEEVSRPLYLPVHGIEDSVTEPSIGEGCWGLAS